MPSNRPLWPSNNTMQSLDTSPYSSFEHRTFKTCSRLHSAQQWNIQVSRRAKTLRHRTNPSTRQEASKHLPRHRNSNLSPARPSGEKAVTLLYNPPSPFTPHSATTAQTTRQANLRVSTVGSPADRAKSSSSVGLTPPQTCLPFIFLTSNHPLTTLLALFRAI